MELSDYWHLVRKWGLLVVAGTLLAVLVAYAAAHLRHHHNAQPLYDGTATVSVNYVQPPGAPYNPNLSTSDDATVLGKQATDPAVLDAVAAHYHIGSPQIRQVTASVTTNIALVTVHVVGTQPRAVQTFAAGLASYLASIENDKINAYKRSLRRTLKPKVAAAYRRWFAAQQRYYVVCGCIGQETHQLVSNQALAALHAKVDLLNTTYQNLRADYDDLSSYPLPPASSAPGAVQIVEDKPPSSLKTILPAAILGLILSIGLAALLDYLQTTAAAPLWPPFSRHRTAAIRTRAPILGSIERAKLNLSRKEQQFQSEPHLRRQILDGLGEAGSQVAEVLGRLAVNGSHTFYITSPDRRTAKGQTILSIAVALVKRGHRVLLIDADPASGGLSAFFGLDHSPGLTDYLSYPAMALPQLLQTIEVGERATLRLLPLGLRPTVLEQRGAQSSSSQPGTPEENGWRQALHTLSQSADVILISGTPTREAPIALKLAADTTGVLLVVRRRQVDDALIQARTVVQRVGASIMGVIINTDKASFKRFPLLEAARGRITPVAEVEATVPRQENVS
jgi:Mrp family chromosome partitioning ATPase